MYSRQAVGLVLRPSNEGMVQTFQLTVDVVRTGSWLVRDAGGNRTHFDRVAAGCLAIWLQRHRAHSSERAMFVFIRP